MLLTNFSLQVIYYHFIFITLFSLFIYVLYHSFQQSAIRNRRPGSTGEEKRRG